MTSLFQVGKPAGDFAGVTAAVGARFTGCGRLAADMRAPAAVAVAVLLASCASPLRGSNPPSASPTSTATNQTTPIANGREPLGSLGVLTTLTPPTYTVSLVSTSGQVVAQAKAQLPSSPRSADCPAPGCNRLAYPLTSASDSRIYFLDGDKDVKYLTPMGETGRATSIALAAKTMAAFSVSPDDRRIAVSLLDYSALPAGQMKLRIYAEDLLGGNRVEFFTASGIAEWPVGWRQGQLVIALGGSFNATGPNPYSATEYHVVDPATGNRSATLGHPGSASGPAAAGAACNRGPLVGAGTACLKSVSGGTELGVQAWAGYYTLLQRTTASANPWLALTPDGTAIAAQLTGSPDGAIFVVSQNAKPAGTGVPLGWIDNDHLLVRKSGHANIFELSSQKLVTLSLDGTFAGTIPGDLDPAGPPAGRGAAQLAYDTTHHTAILFGGQTPYGDLQDTWTWDGRRWSQVTTDIAPPARQGGAFVYDPVRHVTLLFGGAEGGWDHVLGDTWTFDGSRWSQRFSASGPGPRAFSVVAFDSRRGQVVLYGGWRGGGQGVFNDVWTWDGSSWKQMPAAANLPQLFPLGLAYGKADDSLLLVGEAAAGSGIGHGAQTWIYDQRAWRQVQPSGKQPCVDHYGGSAQDPQRDNIVFFGGYCGDGTVTFNGTAWAALTPSVSPAIRGNEAGRPAMTYDPDHQVVLMFGGVLTGTYYDDTWAWDGAHWTRVG